MISVTDIVISNYVQTYATKDLELTHIKGHRALEAETVVDLAIITVDLAEYSMTKTISVVTKLVGQFL